ncbi:MAG: hypothetical protein FD120_1122 [Gammaproteobacteria bacterium]|nr:MAG: hypothetical protein FD120_1122 [Gammaproteobacteria bacterium]
MKSIEHALERLMFGSRWLLAPFYLGLVFCIVLLLVKFSKEVAALVPVVFTGEGSQVIIGILSLIDITLVANLLIIIIFAGYENFVSKIHTDNHEDRPDWMGHVNFSDLKMKVIGSIVAISAIELLKSFVNVHELSSEQLAWKVGIHLTFIVSGVMFALMDWLTSKE